MRKMLVSPKPTRRGDTCSDDLSSLVIAITFRQSRKVESKFTDVARISDINSSRPMRWLSYRTIVKLSKFCRDLLSAEASPPMP